MSLVSIAEPDGWAHRRMLDMLAGWREWALKCSENEIDHVGPTTYLTEMDQIMRLYQEVASTSCPCDEVLQAHAQRIVGLIFTGAMPANSAEKP